MTHTTPELITVPAITTAVVRGQVEPDNLRDFFDTSFSTLAETLSTQGISIAGPAFGLYRDTTDDVVELEVGYPTDGEVRPDGDVTPASLPAGRVARVVHQGNFDGLDASWQQLRAWMDENGLRPRSMWWEVYVTEPSPDMDPDELRTELNAPVDD
jgi:effector-binding domain-containing protein